MKAGAAKRPASLEVIEIFEWSAHSECRPTHAEWPPSLNRAQFPLVERSGQGDERPEWYSREGRVSPRTQFESEGSCTPVVRRSFYEISSIADPISSRILYRCEPAPAQSRHGSKASSQ